MTACEETTEGNTQLSTTDGVPSPEPIKGSLHKLLDDKRLISYTPHTPTQQNQLILYYTKKQNSFGAWNRFFESTYTNPPHFFSPFLKSGKEAAQV